MNKPLWSPLLEGNFKDPYPMYHELRTNDPVHRAQTGEWIITSYHDIKGILSSKSFLVGNKLEWIKRSVNYLQTKSHDLQSIVDAMDSFLLFQNPPKHEQLRRAILSVWDNRSVEEMIKFNITTLLNKLTPPIDLVRDLGQQLPAMTISELLGVPEGDFYKLKALAVRLIKALDLYISLDDLVRIDEASNEFINYFSALVEKKQKDRDHSIISRLIESNFKLSQNELVSACIFLFVAGEETTSGTITTGIYNLCRNPAQLEGLRNQSNKMSMAVNELLRYDPPVQLLGRIASQDTVIKSKKINKGDTVTLCIGSGNRDAQVFQNSNELKIDRHPNPHLSFGAGIHYCLGDWLAKLQTELALQHLLARFNHIELENDQPDWNNHLAIRSLKSLPISLS